MTITYSYEIKMSGEGIPFAVIYESDTETPESRSAIDVAMNPSERFLRLWAEDRIEFYLS